MAKLFPSRFFERSGGVASARDRLSTCVQESGYHEAPQELLRGPPPVTTGRAPITTGAKLPSAYGHQTARVLHNPRPICTVFPSVHPLQVSTEYLGC